MVNFYRNRHSLLHDQPFTESDRETLQKLEARIDNTLKTHSKFANGAFVRLCGRSPKDGQPYNPKNIISLYWQKLATRSDQFPHEPDFNYKLRMINELQWMKVSSGREVMSLLLTSERASIDFIDWIKYGEPEQVVLRTFDPNLKMENEFRAFIFKGNFNALSQYDHYCVYPMLQDPKLQAIIKSKIFSYWKMVHPFVGEDSYVMDFGFFPNNENLEDSSVLVIEISPFLTCTGTALFSWKKDEAILNRTQSSDFEFRILESYKHEVEKLIIPNWEERWKADRYDELKRKKEIPLSPQDWLNDEFYIPPFDHYYKYASSGEQLKGSDGLFQRYQVGLMVLMGICLLWFPLLWFPAALTCYVYYKSCHSNSQEWYTIFVYGTLRRSYHWNEKFLSFGARFISEAESCTKEFLVVGESGVPYVLESGQGGCQIIGEVWEVTRETLLNLDEYEGVSKNYYIRTTISVLTQRENRIIDAFIYKKKLSHSHSEKQLQSLQPLREYSLDLHRRLYRPIRHIGVKQEAYLGVEKERH